MRRRMFTPARVLALAVFAATIVSVPLSGAAENEGREPANKLLSHVSQSVAARYFAAHPEAAPERLREGFERLQRIRGLAPTAPQIFPSNPTLMNDDFLGLPQNEESISVCEEHPNELIGGTNDYRGLLDPEQNFTGWHHTDDGGFSLAKEGLLPSINGIPSGGDPVDVAFGRPCDFYASSLNYDPADPFTQPNGIGVYKTNDATLDSAACNPVFPFDAADPDCWPVRRLVAFTPNNNPNQFHFLDKEWLHVGFSPGFGRAVWVTYSDFRIPGDLGEDFNASIYAVRCGPNLQSCSDPILISGDDIDVQFSDVTVAPDGSTYITWSEILGELEGGPQTFVHKLRVAPPGSKDFGPERIIHREVMAIPFGGFLQANDFRVATYPKNTVAPVGQGLDQRVWVIWDACKERPLDTICVEPWIKLTWSDDDGATWAPIQRISAGGVNYFPTIDYDSLNDQIDACWFTNRFDFFDNAQDVECVVIDPDSGEIMKRRARITPFSNEPEADPLLGGFFIGDYIEVDGYGGVANVHYNANYREVPLLAPFGVSSIPINQQDNFLIQVFGP